MNAPAAAEDRRYSDVEDELRASVRALLAKRAGGESVVARTESEHPIDTALWRTLSADLGLAGLAVPEASGGAGATWREVAVVCEELGRAVAPVPFLGSAVIATAALLELAGGAPDLLSELAAGERMVALAVPFDIRTLRPRRGKSAGRRRRRHRHSDVGGRCRHRGYAAGSRR